MSEKVNILGEYIENGFTSKLCIKHLHNTNITILLT